MITLDEAIAHTEWAANNCEGECSEEHRQLAEWLRELRRARMEIDLLKTLRDGFKADVKKLKDENAKLRSERDHWHVEQVHAYGNWEDTHKYAAKLKSENDELRELARKNWFIALSERDALRIHGVNPDDGAYITALDETIDEARATMQELGIEVE